MNLKEKKVNIKLNITKNETIITQEKTKQNINIKKEQEK